MQSDKMNGRSIRIYLVDGDASGLLTAEVMNWSGKMLVAPRFKLAELSNRDEITRTGVYVLAGPDPENPLGEIVYVGEGDNVFKRLATHDKDEKKEFGTRCVAVISKDLNLTKAHVRYLESRLISLGQAAGRASIHNGTTPPLPPMPESDVADMEGFLEHIELMFPVLGFSFLKPKPIIGPVSNGENGEADTSPVLELSSGDAYAKAQEINGEFVVLKGSTATLQPRPSWTSYRALRDRLVEDKKLVETTAERRQAKFHDAPRRDESMPDDGEASSGSPETRLLSFVADVVFSSPSAAAAVVVGGNTNGRVAWKVSGTRETYGDWHQSKLPTQTDRDDS